MTYYQIMKRILSAATDKEIKTALKYFAKGYKVFVGKADAVVHFYEKGTGFG